MAVSAAVAIRYAKSLIGLAEEKGVLDVVKTDLEGVVKLAEDSHDFTVFLKSPVIDPLKKKQILLKMFDGKVNDLTLSLFGLTAEKKRESILLDIAKTFLKLYNNQKGIVEVNLSSAVAMEAGLKEELRSKLSKQSGKTIQFSEEVDPDLIGGYVLRVEDRQIDMSVRNQLSEIRQSFKA